MYKLLTKKDLAARWQVSEKVIDNWRKKGILTPIENIPSIRFNPQYISELEGTKLNPMSPLERRRLEGELEKWKLRAQKAEKVLQEADIIIIKVICEREEDN